MGYYNRDNESQQYEDWHKYGRDRGFFDRASDEVRSWFGDEDASQRRQMDQRYDEENRGHENERPEWQRRGYGGSSPRGSRMEEMGRYDDPQESRRSGVGVRSGDQGRRQWGEQGSGGQRDWGGGQSWGGQSWGGQRGGGRDWNSQRQDWPGRQQRDWGREESSRFGSDRDIESGMPYGSRMGREQSGWGGQGVGAGIGSWLSGRQDSSRSEQESGFRGRGPRNYRRSDERISDEINEELTMDPQLDATDIDVTVEEGIVTLRGRVNTRQCKRMAEDIAEDVFGVREVHNELRIERGGLFGNQNQEQQSGRQNVMSR